MNINTSSVDPWPTSTLEHNVHNLERVFVCKTLRAFIEKETNFKNVEISERDAITIAPELPSNINWQLLEKIAARNGLIAILQSMLDPLSIPEERRQKWKRHSIQILFNYKQAEKATADLFKVLEEENILAVAMRGMALTQWVYSDPILRPMVDVDILIPTEARHKFREKLKCHGLICNRVLRSQFIYEIENTKIEVHWSFLTPKRYRAAANFDSWIDSRQVINTSAGSIYCFSPENEFLDLVCHAFIHHELDTLLKLTDIALVARCNDLDWDYIAQWCYAASMTRQITLTLGLIDYLFDFTLLEHFPIKKVLSAHPINFYEAYAARFFQLDTVASVLRRKQTLLFVAEKPIIKIRQLLRFLSKDQFSEVMKIARSQARRVKCHGAG